MNETHGGRTGLPLFLSMLGYALACLLAVVLVNFAVILALPRPAPEIYYLRDIEAVLAGKTTPDADKTFTISIHPTPPPLPTPGGFRARVQERMAKDLGVRPQDVIFSRPPSNPLMDLTPNYNAQSDARWQALRQQTFRLLDLTAASDQVVLGAPFVVARRLPDGQWRVVESKSRQLLDPWTRGVLVWLLVSAVALAPLAYLFARMLSSPISAFAAAAHRLGRDPNAPPLEVSGAAEIGVAAQAFNEMQERLRRYVQDRTSMIGAVAHDLRTPLTRLRFHIESAPPALRQKMAADIADMDAMVAATLDFVREAGQTRERSRLELSSLLDRVIEDFAELGRDVKLEAAEPAVIEGDSLGLKRMFANLIDNAVKFGDAAKVSLRSEDGAVVVDIDDAGPGLHANELEGVFEPFHRAEPSRSRDTGGIGLGLPVARSVARAHGGDVTLENLPQGGLRARVSLPV